MTSLHAVLFVALACIATAAFAYALLQPRFEIERKSKNRLEQYRASSGEKADRRVARDRLQEAAKRRRTLQASLDELDQKQKQRDKHTKKLSLERRIEQAGLKVSRRAFILLSLGLGVFVACLGLVLGASPLIALGLGISGGLGLPRWTLGYLYKRRQAKFVAEFANAVDVIVRGIRSGLPLNDTLRMIAAETPEPVRSEFARIVEAQQMGMSLPQAVERLYLNMPLAETNFFAIVVTIQSQAGGNLAEALSNLSRVLRDRRRMKDKIQAMSMEAKASGAIIGALPIVVGCMVYLTTPDYIMVLFTTTIGHLVLGASAAWMAMGIFVMRKMIQFDF